MKKFTKSQITNRDMISQKWGLYGILMALPALSLVVVFVYVPLFMNIGYSFTDFSSKTRENLTFIGLNNFRSLFLDKDFSLVLRNTLYLTVLYVVILNTMAIIFSVLITQATQRYGSVVKTVLYFPCLIAMAVVGFIWRILYSYKDGFFNTILRGIGFEKVPQWLGDPKMIMPSVAIAIIWYALGYYVVIYYAGLMAIPTELYEASAVEGSNRLQDFRFVTFPLLAPSITINVILTTMAIIGSFDLPFTLTSGGGPGRFGTTIPLWIYKLYFGDYQFGESIALSVLLMAVAIVVALLELKVLTAREEDI